MDAAAFNKTVRQLRRRRRIRLHDELGIVSERRLPLAYSGNFLDCDCRLLHTLICAFFILLYCFLQRVVVINHKHLVIIQPSRQQPWKQWEQLTAYLRRLQRLFINNSCAITQCAATDSTVLCCCRAYCEDTLSSHDSCEESGVLNQIDKAPYSVTLDPQVRFFNISVGTWYYIYFLAQFEVISLLNSCA